MSSPMSRSSTPSRLTRSLQHMPIGTLWFVMVAASLVLSEIITSMMGWLLLGEVTEDFLLTGLVASVLVASLVSGIILHFTGEMRRMNDILIESETLLRQSQQVASVGHYVYDIITGFWSSSEALDDIFGIDADFVRDVPGWLSLIHSDQRNELEVYLRDHVVREGNPFDREYRIRRPSDGADRWLHGRGHLVMDDRGRPIRMFGTIQDITERKISDERFENERARLRTLVKTIPDLVWLKDPDGVYLSCNPAFERFFGAGEAQIVGKTDYDFLDKKQADSFRQRDIEAVYVGLPSVSEEWITYASNGQRALLETIKTPMRDGAGNLIGVLGIARDITDRVRAEERIKLAASVFEHAYEGICITDARESIIDVNPAFTEVTGYSRAEVIGRTPRILKSGRQSPEFYSAMWKAVQRDGYWRGEVWNRGKSGRDYAEMLTVSCVRDTKGAITHYVGVMTDITRLKEHERQLEKIAHFDALTGIPNRVLLADRMTQAIARTNRSDKMMAVCYLDLDGFKPVNDLYGHEAGDRLLVEMASRLTGCLRGGDTVARLGGDEFVLLLLDLELPEEYEAALHRILESVALPVAVCTGEEIVITASIGVSLYPPDDSSPDILLRHADQAMYTAKQRGRDRYQLFEPDR